MMTPWTKILTASHVKNHFGAIARHVSLGDYQEVVVENHGQPMVAIIPIKDLETIRIMKKETEQRESLNLLRQARKEVQSRLKKTSRREALQIADRFSRKFVEDLKKEKTVSFERKSS